MGSRSEIGGLQVFDARHNHLAGDIPASLLNSSSICILLLSDNILTGIDGDAVLSKNFEKPFCVVSQKGIYTPFRPALLLQDNRLSCSLPAPASASATRNESPLTACLEQTFSTGSEYRTYSVWIEHCRALFTSANANSTNPAMILSGNMWDGPLIQDTSRLVDPMWDAAPFLYFDRNSWANYALPGFGMITASLVGGAVLVVFVWRTLPAEGEPGEKTKSINRRLVRVYKLCMRWLGAFGILLLLVHLPAYATGANYFNCGNPLLRTTSAYLADAPTQAYVVMVGNLFVAVLGIVLVWRFYRIVEEEKDQADDEVEEYEAREEREADEREYALAAASSMWVRSGWTAAWLGATLALSVPTGMYAATTSIPIKGSSFSALLELVHFGAPVCKFTASTTPSKISAHTPSRHPNPSCTMICARFFVHHAARKDPIQHTFANSLPSLSYSQKLRHTFRSTRSSGCALLTPSSFLLLADLTLINSLVVPLLVKGASRRMGIPSSWLLLVSRLLVAWVVPLMVVIWLDNTCTQHWVNFWDSCNDSSEIEQMDVHGPNGWLSVITVDSPSQYFISTTMVNASREICLKPSLHENAYTRTNPPQCARAVISTLAPLLLKKMAIAALALPAITILKWRSLPSGLTARLYCRSSAPPARDIDLDDIMAQTLTWLDLAIVFGPQVPLLVPLVLMAIVGQRWSTRVGLARLGKREVGWRKSQPAVWSVALSLVCGQALNIWVFAYAEQSVDGVGGVGKGTDEAVRALTWVAAVGVGAGIAGAWAWQAWGFLQRRGGRTLGRREIEVRAVDMRERSLNRVPLLGALEVKL